MKRNYLELKNFLENRFPDLKGHIYGGNYPPPPWSEMLASLLGFAQIATMLVMFMGDNIMSMLGYTDPNNYPDLYKQIQENKMTTFMIVFFANSFVSSMTTTGAFEVYYRDNSGKYTEISKIDVSRSPQLLGDVIFSKLESGRMPRLPEIIQRLAQQGLE